jgi:hypothetical protein
MSDDQSTYTIIEFCNAERMSRGMWYKLAAQGKAPRIYYVGNSPRISHEAREEWRAKLEAEAANGGAR